MPETAARPPHKAERTRAAILAAAEGLFARRGYSATRLEDVAAAVGVKRAALFYHFRDKQALYDAVIEDAFGALVARLDTAFAPPGPIAPRIERAVEAFVDVIVARPALARLILRHAAEAEEQPTTILFPAAERLLRMSWSLFEEGRRSGELEPLHDDPFHTASAVIGATVFYVSALAPLLPPGDFDPLAPAQVAAHKRDALRTARRLLGIGAPRRVSMIDFEGQVVIVTGAGRGLGRLYAMEIARRGGSVVVNDLGSTMHGEGSDASFADQVAWEIERAGGVAVASHDSVASPEGGAAIVRTAVDRFGRLDAVVSNAGIFQTAEFAELALEDWRRMLNVHLDGSFHVSQPAFRVMKSQGQGRFVFIASSAGLFGQPRSAHYAAAKAGIIGLTNVIAIEGAAHGILANSVLPFGCSRMVTETIGGEQVAARSPFLRAIDPALVVPIVVFLASRACALTHHNYSAGAGRYARVFVGLGEGWLAEPGSEPTADDIAAHLAEVSASEPFSVPASIFDEVTGICARLGITG